MKVLRVTVEKNIAMAVIWMDVELETRWLKNFFTDCLGEKSPVILETSKDKGCLIMLSAPISTTYNAMEEMKSAVATLSNAEDITSNRVIELTYSRKFIDSYSGKMLAQVRYLLSEL